MESDYTSERNETRWSIWHECDGPMGYTAGYGHGIAPWFETPWYTDKDKAIAAWNRRVVEYRKPTTLSELKDENAKLRETIADIHEALCADRIGTFHNLIVSNMEDDMRELGIEVP